MLNAAHRMAAAEEVRGMVVLGGRARSGVKLWLPRLWSLGSNPNISLMCPISVKWGHRKVVRIKYMYAIHFYEAWHVVRKEG